MIEDDLGITGDDGYDLIQSFAKKYSVDISNFQYSNYFYPEPNFFDEPKKVIPLTVDDLLNAINQSKLQ